jgi:signal peptidase I
MAITEQEFGALKREAQRLHRAYRSLKESNRDAPEHSSVAAELETIRARYVELEARLNNAENHSSEEISRLPQFDVEPYRVHKPVVTDPDADHWASRILTAASPRVVISTLLLLFMVSVLFMVSNKYIGFFIVPSSSMEPTLIPHDKLVTFRKTEYERGDIVVIRDPMDEESFMVKRIVAKANDDIYVNQGTLMVNSTPIREPYIKETVDYEFGPYRIPEGQIFVLGDNRNNSEDGHHWGWGVPKNSIVGQVKYIYSPSARLRALPEMNQVFVAAGT